jgi:hypothetical protein
MTDEERQAITFLMSFFNPSELIVNKGYRVIHTHGSCPIFGSFLLAQWALAP